MSAYHNYGRRKIRVRKKKPSGRSSAMRIQDSDVIDDSQPDDRYNRMQTHHRKQLGSQNHNYDYNRIERSFNRALIRHENDKRNKKFIVLCVGVIMLCIAWIFRSVLGIGIIDADYTLVSLEKDYEKGGFYIDIILSTTIIVICTILLAIFSTNKRIKY